MIQFSGITAISPFGNSNSYCFLNKYFLRSLNGMAYSPNLIIAFMSNQSIFSLISTSILSGQLRLWTSPRLLLDTSRGEITGRIAWQLPLPNSGQLYCGHLLAYIHPLLIGRMTSMLILDTFSQICRWLLQSSAHSFPGGGDALLMMLGFVIDVLLAAK